MKKVIVLTMLGLMFSVLNAQQKKPSQAPLSPEFVRYVKMLRRGEIKRFTSDGHALGVIPHPMKVKREIPAGLKKVVDLPTVYDLRTLGTLTPVKNQLTCGACWTFATMGSVESRWLDMGLVPPYDLSEQHLHNTHGFEFGHCIGGNAFMSTAYFSRGNGPISEADDPYNIADSTSVAGLTPQAYIPDARFLPNDGEVLKQTIYDYGAVYTDMYWDDTAYNPVDYTYYYSGSDTVANNHAVLLVGWNDTKQVNGHYGAWIIRNSWGTSWGENGFFYISYDDTKVNTSPAFWPDRMDYDPNATVHYYDKFGWVGSMGWVYQNPPPYDNEDYGLVKFVASQDQQITKVGTWVHDVNSTVSFSIYDDFNGVSLSNPLGSTGDSTCVYVGYYTFDLPSPITLNNGDDFYVKGKYNTPNTQWSVPIEMFQDGYANPVIETGKCWVSDDGNNFNWLAIGTGTGYDWDLCIKAYGTSPSALDEDGPDTPLPRKMILHQNYPNPFNPTTTIGYTLPTAQHVRLIVYNTLGHEVAKLVDEQKGPGQHSVDFDASELSSGVYVYRITAGDHTAMKKLLLLK